MEECAWRENDGVWETDCGHEFVINDGQPSENEMSFCCYCGKEIVQFPKEHEEC